MDFDPLNHVHKFVPHELSTKKEDYKDCALCKLMVAYNDKRKLTPEEQTFEDRYFSELGHRNAYRNGTYRLMGYEFDFRPFFKKWLVKFKYDGWDELYAPNKTFIRRHATSPSHILQIIELK